MKRLGIITVFVFLMTMLVASAAYLNAPDITIQSQKGTTSTGTLALQNTHTTDSVALTASSFTFDSNEFKDNDGDSAVITFSSPGIIAPSASVNVNVNAVASSKLDEGKYSADVLVQNGAFNDTFKLTLVVNPDICDEGLKGDLKVADWDLKKNPETDEKDEYYAGDKIVIQDINVENNGDDEITDVVVEAVLYDLTEGDELDSVKSDSFNLNDGNDKNVEDLEFNVPLDADEESDFAVYLKVYEDGEEDTNCNFESKEIIVKKRSRDVKIDLTGINPQTAKCGDYVDFNINIKNVGSKDDDSIYVKIQDPALKITGQTASFSLDSDDETTKTVRVQLPEDLADGLYSIESVVVYSGTTPRSDFGNLTVACEAANQAPVSNAGLTQTVDANNIVTLNGASSSDSNNDQLTYLWTQISGLQVQLSNPTSVVTTFTPASPDTYVFKLDVSDGRVTSSATTTVVVRASTVTGETTYAPTSAWDLVFKESSLQKAAWVVAIIVLLLVSVYFLKLILSPAKGKPQQPQMPLPQPEFP